MKLCKEALLVNSFKFTEGLFDIYFHSKDMEDFHNLQGKLEPVTLNTSLFFRAKLFNNTTDLGQKASYRRKIDAVVTLFFI